MADPGSEEEEIFDRARTFASIEERQAFLREACTGNPALRQRVDRLLDAAEGAESFFGKTAQFPFENRTQASPSPVDSSTANVDTLAGSGDSPPSSNLKWHGLQNESPPRFVEGVPDMDAETADLLHRRLHAISWLLLGMIATMAFAESQRPMAQTTPVQGLPLFFLIVAVTTLRIWPRWSLKRLRILEGCIMASLVVSGTVLQGNSIVYYFEQGDHATVGAIKFMGFFRPAMFILIYGTFIPHRWQTAALIFAVAGLVPILNLYRLAATHPGLAVVLNADRFGLLLPLPLFAAFTATVAAHVIHSMRREAFRSRRFAQYQLKHKIGAGGMGEVYQAEHLMLKRPCAIKFIAPGSGDKETALLRFEREVRAAAQLTHWNTIEIYDFGRTDDGRFYYVMELLPGRNLQEIIQKHGAISPARTVHLLRQTCAALTEAHSLGLIHRDIKPANLYVTRRGGVWDVVKLLDFGLVKQTKIQAQAGTEVSRAGDVMGSPTYMSPEQAESPGKVDARADIYSIGVMGYQMLTGKPPFVGDTAVQLLVAHARDTPAPPSEFNPDISPDLEEILMQCLEKDREKRPADVTLLADALSQCSVANDWNALDAATWWNQKEAKLAKTTAPN